jgi:predicted NAD/FAD-dependent oxidoreductase
VRPVAIVGAGLAGLAAARTLRGAGRSVRLFDKGRAPGGRLATRRISHDGREHRFDHGAQYLRAEGAGFAALLEAAGAKAWPDPARRVPLPGMSALGRHMAAGLDVTTGCTVTALRREGEAWFIRHEAGEEGPFAALVVTTPAPQAVPLLASHAPAMAAALAAVRYAPCWTVLAAFATRLDLPDTLRDAAAGVIGWAARDSAKPGRDAAQENWVIQAGPTFSRAHLEDAPGSVVVPLLAALPAPAPTPLFAVAHRWRYSLLEAPLGHAFLREGSLGYASDGCLGGRAEAAFDSGEALAAALLAA